MSKKTKIAIIGGCFLLLATIISSIFAYRSAQYAADHTHSTPTVTQSSTKGSNVAVTGDSNNVVADNTGPTVVSIGQSGGVTALNYYNITQVTRVIATHSNTGPTKATGAIYKLDSSNKTITFHPKSGAWSTPFIAVPINQVESIQPHLSSESQLSMPVTQAYIVIEGDSLKEFSSSAASATPGSGYILHYATLPTYFIFGDRNGPIYKANHLDQ
jgi:hypothetical protein